MFVFDIMLYSGQVKYIFIKLKNMRYKASIISCLGSNFGVRLPRTTEKFTYACKKPLEISYYINIFWTISNGNLKLVLSLYCYVNNIIIFKRLSVNCLFILHPCSHIYHLYYTGIHSICIYNYILYYIKFIQNKVEYYPFRFLICEMYYIRFTLILLIYL